VTSFHDLLLIFIKKIIFLMRGLCSTIIK